MAEKTTLNYSQETQKPITNPDRKRVLEEQGTIQIHSSNVDDTNLLIFF
jgi:hypothetical protein